MKVTAVQWIGKREHQEDAYAVEHYPDGVLMVVCDGMGGHDNGALAARLAISTFIKKFKQLRGDKMPCDALRTSLDAANDAVGGHFKRHGGYGGCTLVAAFAGRGIIRWVSVGDSTLFLWRRGRLLRLNADHSMRAVYMPLVQSGAMSYEEAMRGGHALRSAVTGEPLSLVDLSFTPYPLLPGDRIILATDGADDILLPQELAESTREILNNKEHASPATLIVEACVALHDEAADNTTVLVLDWA